MIEYLPLLLFAGICIVLMFGYPVAFSLAGTSLIFAGIGILTNTFDSTFLTAVPNRVYGIIVNANLLAVPLFIFMGIMLEKSKLAQSLLESMAVVFAGIRGGLGISVIFVGALLAASTGIVGATVVTMGVLSVPTMLRSGYSPSLVTGTICATGTLGQIIPPSIALVLLGEVISNAYQQAQLDLGIFSPKTVSIGDLFAGAIVPGLILVLLYMTYMLLVANLRPSMAPRVDRAELNQGQNEVNFRRNLMAALKGLIPTLALIIMVLGSILKGIATPTEAAGVGAMGATLLALFKSQLNRKILQDVVTSTTKMTSMIYLILMGAAIFSLVFRGFNGVELVESLLRGLPGGVFTATLVVMLVIFLLGFILDFIEITFMVVPIIGPVLLAMGLDPVWLGIMLAINLQTSFLTPPFGFALFYLRGVLPSEIATTEIYKGVIPFIGSQLLMLGLLSYWPQLATWLPSYL